jgi:predicted  nucleic acid-binding Zn-ribbon protein
MNPAIGQLLELQRIDRQIATLRAELEGLPRRLRDADARLNAARAAVAAAKDAQTASLKERKKLELDAEQWRERARKYRDQSGAVKTNEAYKALQHEIANAEAEVGAAEDRQLEHMMRSEQLDRDLRAAEDSLKEADRAVATERADLQGQQKQRERELQESLAAREQALAPLEENVRDRYARIARRHPGSALSEARNEQCLGCGMRVLPYIFQEVRRADEGVLHFCETCGRILYFVESAAPPAEDTANSASGSPR